MVTIAKMAAVVPPVALGIVTRERSVSPGKKLSVAISLAGQLRSGFSLEVFLARRAMGCVVAAAATVESKV